MIKKGLFVASMVVLGAASLFSQQMAHSSHLSDAQILLNPASVAPETELQFDVFARQQWLGFNGAPLTGMVAFGMPIIDYNMSVGGMITFDKAGPITKTGLTINYAYKLRELIADYDQLSVGIGGTITNYAFGTSGLVVNDVDDLLLAGSGNSTIFPALSAGFLYTSNGRRGEYRKFWMGAGMQQIITTNVDILGASAQRENQYYFGIGTRIYNRDGYIEPYLNANLSRPEIMDMLVGVRYEQEERFWAGIGYSTVNELALQGGWIIPEINGRYTYLRLGVIGNVTVSESLGDFGPGIEFIASYRYDLD